MKEFSRISMPLKFVNNIDHLLTPSDRNKVPIISCKNRKKNLYDISRDRKWSDSQLASNEWKNSKYIGDYFKINCLAKPACKVSNSLYLDLGLESELVNILIANGFQKPTFIQSLSIPPIMKGFNTMIGGETGCGKTLAYVTPILNAIMKDTNNLSDSINPSALIVAPSWELCYQINNYILALTKYLDFNSCLLKSSDDININSKIIVSTPHTMLSAINAGDFKCNKIQQVVFDEADVLFDKSFADCAFGILSRLMIQTTRPIDEIAIGNQLILCNATCPTLIEESFGKFVPIETFQIIQTNDMQKLIPNVSHKFLRLSIEMKPITLITLLKPKGLNSNDYTIVFCDKTETINTISNLLSENRINFVALHKNLSMDVRLENFNRFQSGEADVLLCTDLGARGLDTSKAKLIINYDFPRFIVDYIHRAGRTGRVGSVVNGKVVSLISCSKEVNAVRIIEKCIRTGVKLPNIDSKIIV